LTSLVAATIGLKNGNTWSDMSQGVVNSISQAMGAIFILLAVGGLIGTWVMSGTVATMIHMGLGILSPALFYPSAIIVCGLVSASIGSSWTTVGTIGIGLIGIANGLGLSEGAAAGAIIKLQRLVDLIMKGVRGTGSLVATTVFTGIATNIIASDQYMAIVLPGRMYRAEFRKRRLAPENLSRAIEDSGTITSPLVPWNTCGAYMAGTLGVATLAYLPFCFFNILSPIISITYGLTGFTIKKMEDGE